MKKSPPKPVARPSRRAKPPKSLAARIVLFALATLAIGFCCVLLFFYTVFSLQVESKLRDGLQHYSAELYSRPFTVAVGRPLSPEQLVRQMERRGYSSRFTRSARTYRMDAAGVDLVDERGRNIRIELVSGVVDAVRLNRQPVPDIDLEPEIISSLSDASGSKRRYVIYEDVPDVLVKAVLSAEDRRFFDHHGIDFWRILKAAVVDLRAGGLAQGASTLTQQCVKNLFLSPEKSFRRKLHEVGLSLILETRLSKRQIFELYVNEVYLGQQGPYGVNGFGQAASLYFHKNLRDVTLSEAAFMAGIVSAPNRFNPYRYPERALAQRNQVLDRMEQNGYIDFYGKVKAKNEPLLLQAQGTYNYVQAPYFVDYVEDQLSSSLTRRDLVKTKVRVYTTLDADLQRAAYEAVRLGGQEIDAQMSKLATHSDSSGAGSQNGVKVPQIALIAMDPRSGEILAMVGGRNFGQSQYNRTTAARRQPGSAFKPFVYAAALETPFTGSGHRITVADIYPDRPHTFRFGARRYSPHNFGEKYLGRANLREALAQSLNVATVHLAEDVGYQNIVALARRAGVGEGLKPYPSMALGSFEVTPLQLAQGYTIFAGQGIGRRARAILRVEGSPGAMPETAPASDVIHPEAAYLVTSLMQSVLAGGTGTGVRQRGFDLPAAGKTGTSNDGWFAGFTPELLCLVWVGFDDGRDINMVGAGTALPIWTEFMKRANQEGRLRGRNFTRPSNMVAARIDPSTGMLAGPNCRRVMTEDFVAGTEPRSACDESAVLAARGETLYGAR